MGQNNSGPIILDWRQTVRLEHEDRKARFKRLAASGFVAGPAFHEIMMSRATLPQFGVDIPVLRVVFPQRVFFDTDRWDIRPEAERTLDLMAGALARDVPDVAVFVAGHADARGTEGHNYELSVARADAVARALFRRGIGNVHLWRVGFGEAVPVMPNDTQEHMAQNRRVELLIAAKPEAIAIWLSRQKATVCAGASTRVVNECLQSVMALPPVVAEPVLRDSAPVTVAYAPRNQTEVEHGRATALREGSVSTIFGGGAQAVGTPHTPEAIVPTPDAPSIATSPVSSPRATVEIKPQDRVIIDLTDERVEVGVPFL